MTAGQDPKGAERSQVALSPLDSAPTNRFHRRVTFLSGMGVFLEGYDFTNIASALIFLVPYFGLTTGQVSALAVSTYIGTIAGALVAGWIADRYGRKTMYMADMILYGGFAVMSALSVSLNMLIASRVGLGFAIGADQALSFTIIAEFAPSKSRGRLNASTWVMWTVASLLTYVISFLLNPILGQQTWRVLFLASIVPVIIVLIMRSRLPETPRWLLMKGRRDDAARAIAETLGEAQAKEGLSALELQLDTGRAHEVARFSQLFSGWPQMRRTLYITFMWFCVTVNTYGIGYFTPYIFKQLGFTAEQSLFGGMMVASFAVIGSVIMMFSVERVGRRTLAITGFGLLAIIDLAISVLSGNLIFIPLLILFSAFQLSAWIGPAGLVGVVAPEVFPTNIRSLGTGFAAAMGRAGSIVGIVALPFLIAHVQLRGAMLFFFADAAIAFVAMIVFGRETKGQSLEDLFND